MDLKSVVYLGMEVIGKTIGIKFILVVREDLVIILGLVRV